MLITSYLETVKTNLEATEWERVKSYLLQGHLLLVLHMYFLILKYKTAMNLIVYVGSFLLENYISYFVLLM